jgi:hypothetical protein
VNCSFELALRAAPFTRLPLPDAMPVVRFSDVDGEKPMQSCISAAKRRRFILHKPPLAKKRAQGFWNIHPFRELACR